MHPTKFTVLAWHTNLNSKAARPQGNLTLPNSFPAVQCRVQGYLPIYSRDRSSGGAELIIDFDLPPPPCLPTLPTAHCHCLVQHSTPATTTTHRIPRITHHAPRTTTRVSPIPSSAATLHASRSSTLRHNFQAGEAQDLRRGPTDPQTNHDGASSLSLSLSLFLSLSL